MHANEENRNLISSISVFDSSSISTSPAPKIFKEHEKSGGIILKTLT